MSGTDKIRLLFKKKPCPDSKTVKDVIGDEVLKDVEFSVMVIGGVGAAAEEAAPGAEGSAADGDIQMEDVPVARGPSGVVVLDAQGPAGIAVLETQQFWEDLDGFLSQRIRDKGVVNEVFEIFKRAWKAKDS